MTRKVPTQLEYGQPPPVHHRKWFHRTLIAAAILCLGTATWVEGPSMWRHIYLQYRMRQAMTYVAPPNSVVYESDIASEVARDLKLRVWGDGIISLSGTASKPPECWDWLCSAGRTGIANNGAPLLFLHRLASPDGKEHLVGLILTRLAFTPSERGDSWELYYSSDRVDLSGGGVSTDSLRVSPTEAGTLKLFAGQPDPSNASHFTIRYQINDEGGTIDGSLDNDGHIIFQIRDGPANPHWLMAHRRSPATLP